MSVRDNFVDTFYYKNPTRVPDFEFGFWTETIRRWANEGHVPHSLLERDEPLLPNALSWYCGPDDWNAKVEKHFGFEKRYDIPVVIDMYPKFEREIMEEQQEAYITRTERGIICKEPKVGEAMPQWLEFPVATKNDYYRFIDERFHADDPGRYPSDWGPYITEWKSRDYPLGIFCGSLYGWLRHWMGFEKLSVLFYDDPHFIAEMMDFLTDHFIAVLSNALASIDRLNVRLDYAHFWEDMCYNKGPLISPAMFTHFMVPRYKKIVNLLHDYGIDIIYVDSDGKIDELVPLWLECGIRCMFPVEAAHTDPVSLKEQYGDDILIMGGIDKRALIEGSSDAIDQELSRIEPLLKGGGYIPHLDHLVPADVGFESYQYYIKRKREIIGRS